MTPLAAVSFLEDASGGRVTTSDGRRITVATAPDCVCVSENGVRWWGDRIRVMMRGDSIRIDAICGNRSQGGFALPPSEVLRVWADGDLVYRRGDR